jgi:hypothetical protein
LFPENRVFGSSLSNSGVLLLNPTKTYTNANNAFHSLPRLLIILQNPKILIRLIPKKKHFVLQPLCNVWRHAVAGAADAADVANGAPPHLDAGAALLQRHQLAGDVDADAQLLRHGEQQAQPVAAVAAAVGARRQATVGAGGSAGARHRDRGGVRRILPTAHSHRPAKAAAALAGGPRRLAQQIAR